MISLDLMVIYGDLLVISWDFNGNDCPFFVDFLVIYW